MFLLWAEFKPMTKHEFHIFTDKPNLAGSLGDQLTD